ncbi:hypothetical protein F5Y16DRAFT_361506 [Xylariaceae sp. FL0255]|nr:hypothetical protein F5Y16DRAFT_361506 [Xylariaceae sp. FL0255]
MSPACLSSLSPELLLPILNAVDSPLELLAIVRASPECYRVFCIYGRSVLSQFLRDTIGEEAIPDALGALYSSELRTPEFIDAAFDRYSDIDPDARAGYEFRRWVIAFLSDFHTKALEFPEDTILLVYLCHIYDTTRALVEDYSSRAMDLFDYELRNEPRDPLLPSSALCQEIQLSKVERTRFFRAFFRYEIFCNCFRPVGLTEPFSSLEESHLFLEPLKMWEVEEFYYVFQYLMTKTAKIAFDLEDQFCRDIMKARVPKWKLSDDSKETLDVVYNEEWWALVDKAQRRRDSAKQPSKRQSPRRRAK